MSRYRDQTFLQIKHIFIHLRSEILRKRNHLCIPGEGRRHGYRILHRRAKQLEPPFLKSPSTTSLTAYKQCACFFFYAWGPSYELRYCCLYWYHAVWSNQRFKHTAWKTGCWECTTVARPISSIRPLRYFSRLHSQFLDNIHTPLHDLAFGSYHKYTCSSKSNFPNILREHWQAQVHSINKIFYLHIAVPIKSKSIGMFRKKSDI